MTLKLVELFAGIGGFSCGFHQAGVSTNAAVEIDPACRAVLQNRLPEAVLFDDVTKVGADELLATGFTPERGILAAGWPCQDISVAGRQRGLAGERSGLFSEVVRLINELQPRWFVLENVARLLSINGGRDMGAVIGALVECGYGLAYRVLNAEYFGVPQRRRRVFFVGCFGNSGAAPAQILFEPESLCGDLEKSPGPTTLSAAQGSGRTTGGSRLEGHVAALTARGVGTCGADDNQAQAGHLIPASLSAVRRLTPLECERLQGFPDNWTAGQRDSARYRMLGNAVAVPVVQWIAQRLVQVDGMMND